MIHTRHGTTRRENTDSATNEFHTRVPIGGSDRRYQGGGGSRSRSLTYFQHTIIHLIQTPFYRGPFAAVATLNRCRRIEALYTIMLRQLFIVSCLAALSNAFVPKSTRPAFYAQSLLRMVAVDTSEIKNGMTIEIEGEPYKVLSFSIMKQARGAAKTTIKFKNLMRGNTIENTYRSGEKFETALIERKPSQYTYNDGVSAKLMHGF